jgi:hypothetical protein
MSLCQIQLFLFTFMRTESSFLTSLSLSCKAELILPTELVAVIIKQNYVCIVLNRTLNMVAWNVRHVSVKDQTVNIFCF